MYSNTIFKVKSLIIFSIICLLFSNGCGQLKGAVSKGWGGDEYEHTYLSIDSPLGAKAFKDWKNFDLDVRDFFKKYKNPDVIYAENMKVTFFYLEKQLQVKFTRPAIGFKTKYVISGIPSELYVQLNKRFK